MLTPKQARFVKEYLLDMNATQAAIRAGYSEKTAHAIGYENLSKPAIAQAIEKAQEKVAKRLDISHEEIIQDLASIAQEARSVGVFAPAVRAKELIGKHFGMWPSRVEHTGKDGGPIETKTMPALDFSHMDADEREALKALLLKAKNKDEGGE